jgi:anaerobic selenocysteine-containing dehydrogenase
MSRDATARRLRICPICEAACALVVETRGREVISCRGNPDDTFSAGHVCPKGIALTQLDADSDRLRVPLIRRNGEHVEASWDEAFALINERLNEVRDAHGNDAVGIYIGNPTAHNVGLSMGFGTFAGALGSRNVFSAGSVDQLPKQLACELMFGDDMAVPVPDIERCHHLLMLGANPIVSNGSLWVIPDVRGHIRRFRDRGGKLVVVDPRRTETAKVADAHLFIRPGTDAWLLAAIFNQLVRSGNRPVVRAKGFDALSAALAPVSLESAATHTGIAADEIQRLAEELGESVSAAVYGRVGTTLQRYGTLTSFLIEAVNVLLGSLDSPGGAMFPEQSFSMPRAPKSGVAYDRYRSRVSGYPEVTGQMPVACLAEEIETPGEGQIRALVTVAGNPVISNPESRRLAKAFESLEFMVSIDIYHNDTTRLADVILPGTSPFEDSHYDSFLGAMTYRNTARYSPALFAPEDRPDEWRMMLSLAHIAAQRRVATEHELDDFEDTVVAGAVQAYVQDPSSGVSGGDVQEIVGAIGPERGVERLLDLGIRAGRWGDHFGRREGLSLQTLIDQPNSIDLGALRPHLDDVIRHADGCVDLAPEVILADLERLRAEAPTDELLLVGRRNIQTNNSWLQNLPLLSKGPDRCVLEMNVSDADALGIHEGDWVSVTSSVDRLKVKVMLTEDLARGVVSMPHGFSEYANGRQSVASARPGVNSNAIAPADHVDAISATVALNGIPVAVKLERFVC